MRTTLDLPDELFRQVKAKAAMEGSKLKDLLTRYVENGLRQTAAERPTRRSELPVIKRRGEERVPFLSGVRQAELEEEADRAKRNRSFGR